MVGIFIFITMHNAIQNTKSTFAQSYRALKVAKVNFYV